MRRSYNSYEEYLSHQKAKLSTINNLEKKASQLKSALNERLNEDVHPMRGRTVLCLGARQGAECEVFIDKGALAIGIDLNPGNENRYVVTGDFHRIQFAEESFDYVYCNSLDHAFDLDSVTNEVSRVLKSNGVFIADIVKGPEDLGGREPGEYEAMWWKSNAAVIDRIQNRSFKVISRVDFNSPWPGTQVAFKKTVRQ